MAAFKIVKSTDWKSSTGSTGTTLVLAASGRVVTANQSDLAPNQDAFAWRKIKLIVD